MKGQKDPAILNGAFILKPTMMQYAFIKTNVTSAITGQVYAVRGEFVKIIADHVTALIVERKSGERVPIKTTDIV